MNKLKLTPEQKVIFQKAISDAYEAGGQDSTFLFNGMHELIKGGIKALEKVTEDYCEKE